MFGHIDMSSQARPLKLLLALALTLTGVQLGVSYAHFMQMHGKLQLPLESYILVQNQVISYRVKLGFIEIPDLFATGCAATLLFGQRPRFIAALGSLLCLVSMWLVWLFFIQPINAQIDTWTVATVPQHWEQLRLQWHELHLARLGLATAAMSCIVFAALQRDAA